jgi:hypothetical protein
MAIDPLNTWKQTLADLPKVSSPIWALNFANWYADRIANIAPDPSALVASSFTFVFNSATFAAQLALLPPTLDPVSGIAGFAAAWSAAIALTIYPVTLLVGPGAFIPPSTPATLFSAVTMVMINPASLVLAQAKIMELVTAPVVSDPMDSVFAEKFRDATLQLSIMVTGLNSIPPPAGPLPLIAPLVPLL